MKKRTLIRLGALAFALALAACDSSSSSSDPQKGEGYGPLQGTWRSDCYNYEGIGHHVTHDFTGNHVKTTFDTYHDSGCTREHRSDTITYRYSVGGEVLTVGGQDAKELNVEVIDDPGNVAEYPREYDIFLIQDDILYLSGKSSPTANGRPDKLDMGTRFWRR